MKKLTALVLICSLLLSLPGCQAKEEEPYIPTGDAILMEGEDPEILEPEKEAQLVTLAYNPDRSMNPLIGYSQNNRVLFSLIYQGLFAVSSDYEAYPILCSQYQVSPSGMVWTFYLEENARFSDGSKVTADDVIASYEAARQSDYYKGRFAYYISEIKPASDGNGVTFMLNAPFENLALLLDVPIVKASDVEAEHPLGTGPYTFAGDETGASLVRVRSWWANTDIPVRADVISLIEAKNDAQVRDEFEFGDVSLVVANPLSDAFADFRCDFELWDIDSGVFLYLGCNVLYSDYFQDGRLRTMLTYAIDRETIVADNYNAHAQPSTLAVSPSHPAYSNSLASKYAFDPMKFIEFTNSWAIPKDPKQPDRVLELLVNSDDSARLRTARYIAKALTEYGLPCKTKEYGGSTYADVLKANNWDIYLGQTRLPPNMDLSEFFRLWGSLSWGGLPVESLLELCKDTLENSGTQYNMLETIANDGRIIPILFGYHAVYAERGLFENLSPARDNAFFYTMGKTMQNSQIDTVYN